MTDKVIGGISLDLKSDKWRVAIHEAGHVAILRHYGIKFDYAVAFDMPVKDGAEVLYGRVCVGENDRSYEDDDLTVVRVYAAGFTAERIFGVSSDRLSTNDMVAMTKAFFRMGILDDTREAARYIEELADILHCLADEILAVAAGLYKYTKLSYDDICGLIEQSNAIA